MLLVHLIYLGRRSRLWFALRGALWSVLWHLGEPVAACSPCGDACPAVLVLLCSPQAQAGPLPSLTGVCVALD